MVVGAAGELPKPPETPVVFLEGVCCFIIDTNCNLTTIGARHGRVADR